jgi:chromosome segregation ATPase
LPKSLVMNKSTLKEKRVEAANIVFEIENELKSAKELINLLKKEFEIANKESSKIKALSPKITSTLENAESTIVDLRKKRDELKRTLKTSEKYLSINFTTLRKQIDDPNNGLNSKIKKGKQFEKSLISLNKNYEKATLGKATES